MAFIMAWFGGQESLPCREEARMKSLSHESRNASYRNERPSIRCHMFRSYAPRWSCSPPRASPMMKLPPAWEPAARSSAYGGNFSLKNASPVWRNVLVWGGPGLFPPELVVQVKALACELPATQGLPLSRWSTSDLAQYVSRSGLVAPISGSTIWRWLHDDAIRPWQHRTWIFPRDPDFALKAGRILDLYARLWSGQALRDDEFVISADEKTSIQAPSRRVFWIVDNGSGHRGQRAVARLQSRYPRLVLVHGPVHASWLNQIEIYFSIVQRKVLTPNDFSSLEAIAERLLEFQSYYESIAKPFEWKFTRQDLAQLLSKL